jgi:hypothetical protein
MLANISGAAHGHRRATLMMEVGIEGNTDWRLQS